MGHWKNRWIQTPHRILMDPCIKQAPVLSKRFWIIPWPLAYNRLELHCVRKIINFWYTFGWKWRVFVTIWGCRTHVRMTSMTSSVERTDLDFKISVALLVSIFWWSFFPAKRSATPQSATQIKDHIAMCNLDLIVSHDLGKHSKSDLPGFDTWQKSKQ